MDLDIDYEKLFSEYVSEVYVEELDEKGLEIAAEYSDRGGNPRVCVGVGLYETEEYDSNLDTIAEELDVSRRAIYGARQKLGLEIRERNSL
ncbi:hypothetical protein GKQ38_01625 [Candidatus Nanohaloarchaea archaeon]|nr:hypothetical protein GKQ38_01625 [Candidatus Nanohaloarchaea archaeon]